MIQAALLRCAGPGQTEVASSTRDQIAKISSSNATASRLLVAASAACTNACLAMITLALRSWLRPRIGRSRAFSRPWSHSMRLLA
jgi:hypothetical protein